MGLFFRKSKKIGLFRLNTSKSGFGLSFGVKGCRFSLNQKGIQFNAGSKGAYYRKSLSWNKLKNNKISIDEQSEQPQKEVFLIERTEEQEKFENKIISTFLWVVGLGVFSILIKALFIFLCVILGGFAFSLKLIITRPNNFKEMIKNTKIMNSYRNNGYAVGYKTTEEEQKRLEKKYKEYNYSYKNYKKG